MAQLQPRAKLGNVATVVPAVLLVLLVLAVNPSLAANLQYQTYVDVGYIHSNRDPQDGEWQGKITTSTLNEVNLHLAMANLWKKAEIGSRWGFEFGLQAGDDSSALVPSPPPSANEPIDNADGLSHLYRANISYLFGGEGEVELTGGLISSFLGYESYLAIDNPNYTRAYLSDAVPFFLVGAEVLWDVNQATDLGFYLISGFNHLADANDVPSFGFSSSFDLAEHTNFKQNFYYGADQQETDVEYWRFHSNSIVEWRGNRVSVAASIDFGREKQAQLPDQPLSRWASGAIWVDWAVTERMSLALRPELHDESDGSVAGETRKIAGVTATLKYAWLPANSRIVTMLEARYDHDRSDGRGFSDENDQTASDQALLIASFMWSFKH